MILTIDIIDGFLWNDIMVLFMNIINYLLLDEIIILIFSNKLKIILEKKLYLFIELENRHDLYCEWQFEINL